MYAAVTTEYNKIKWQQVKTPVISDNEVLVKVGAASICGSDEHIFKGDFHPRTSVPLVQGHEFMGVIAEKGKQVSGLTIGDRVVVDPIIWCGRCPACKIGHYPACTSLKLVGVDRDGGFGQYVNVAAHMVFKLPDDVSDHHAALVELYGVAFHSCQRSGLKKGDSALIYGTGKVGHCVYQAARTITDNTIFLVDISEERLQVAQQNYHNIVTINARQDDPVQVIKQHTDGAGVDVAFEVVGHAHPVPDRVHPVRACIQSIRGAGVVCVLGLADDPAPLNMKELIWKEARIIASRVSHGEMKQAIEHLSQGTLKPEAVISQVMPASEASLAFEQLNQYPDNHLKIILNFD
ncbi:MAG: zinc-dependent alcohol dehydrogenase [Candidatus Cyclobacteriaceae bacterium M3_2C_046]